MIDAKNQSSGMERSRKVRKRTLRRRVVTVARIHETSQLRKIVGQIRWLPSCATSAIQENEICAYHDESITFRLSGRSFLNIRNNIVMSISKLNICQKKKKN